MISRRDFLKFLILFPNFFSNSKKKEKDFKFLEISGSYREIGFKIGKFFKKILTQF